MIPRKRPFENMFSFHCTIWATLKLWSANNFNLDKVWNLWSDKGLTLSQTTYLDSSKLKEFADDIFKFDEKGIKFSTGYKTLWEKKKLLIVSNFSFSHSVFERRVLRTPKNKGLFGKGLMVAWYIFSPCRLPCVSIRYCKISTCSRTIPWFSSLLNLVSWLIISIYRIYCC